MRIASENFAAACRRSIMAALRLAAVVSVFTLWLPPLHGAEAQADKPKFDIWEYQINGNTKLEVERIEKAVYPFLGEGKDIDDVEHARNALVAVGAANAGVVSGGSATGTYQSPPQASLSNRFEFALTRWRRLAAAPL